MSISHAALMLPCQALLEYFHVALTLPCQATAACWGIFDAGERHA